MFASHFGNLKIVKKLITAGAEIDATDKDGNTALLIAAKLGYDKVVGFLIESNADINVQDNLGWTSLMRAVIANQPKVVSLLLQHSGCRVESSGHSTRETALLLATSHGLLSIVKMLINHGANVNAQDKFKRTPLMVAAFAFYYEICVVLLDNVADLEMQDVDNKTALDWAKKTESKNSTIIELLEGKMSKLYDEF